jgi:transposase InsO family protein
VHDDLVKRRFTASGRCCDDCWNPSVPVEEIRESLTPQRFTRIHGRVRACADNAATESFFALLQRNVLDRKE